MRLTAPPVTPVVTPQDVTFLNGIQINRDQPIASMRSHALQFGDSIFEGMRVVSGKLLQEEEHTARLYRSAQHLELEMIPKDVYRATLVEAIKASGHQDAYIRVQVLRGKGSLGIDSRTCESPSIAIDISKLELYPAEVYENGIALAVAKHRKVPKQCLDYSEIKCGNYLNNKMALKDAQGAKAKDALMITLEGWVSEASVANIFWIKENTLYTPSLETNCLEGTTINRLCELAKRLGYKVMRGEYPVPHLLGADEAALTGTGAGILAIATVDGNNIGSGKCGPQIKRIASFFKETINEVLTDL